MARYGYRRRRVPIPRDYETYTPPVTEIDGIARPPVLRKMVHQHFYSTTAYAAWAAPLTNAMIGFGFQYSGIHTSGLDDINEAVKMLTHGDETHAREAHERMMELSLQINTPHYIWEDAIVGEVPNVPAFCAGMPDDMYHRQQSTSDRTPLRIWMGMASEWTITERQIRDRGIALCAFALALAEIRPVYITPYVNRHGYGDPATTGGSIISWDIQTSPLVLSELLASSHPKVTRHLGVPATSMLNDQPPGFADIKPAHFTSPVPSPDDLWLGPITQYDPLLTDPVGWIKREVAKYSQEDE